MQQVYVAAALLLQAGRRSGLLQITHAECWFGSLEVGDDPLSETGGVFFKEY